VIVGGSFDFGARAWREATEEIRIESAGLTYLEVRTHNGKVAYDGEDAAAEVLVVAKKRGGGRTEEAAEEALAAIEVYAEAIGDNSRRVGWRWKEPRRSSWQGAVEFEITGPASLGLDVETHNGAIVIDDLSGGAKLVTHNGALTVDAKGPKLQAETHNGCIQAVFAGDDVALSTHNGEIEARLLRAGPVSGTITTHNGGVELAVAEGVASQIHCTTHNGHIKMEVPNESTEVSTRLVKASIGGGGPPLAISTHNGSIKVRPAGS
jgi:hypothetical protein